MQRISLLLNRPRRRASTFSRRTPGRVNTRKGVFRPLRAIRTGDDMRALGGIRQMRPELNTDLTGMALDAERRRRIAETLGGCGLNDDDIARYHRLPMEVVAELRDFWGIAPNV